jgi:hypothetical protein
MANTCKCLNELPQKVLDFRKQQGEKKEERASITPTGFFLGDGGIQTISYLEIVVTGRKSPLKVNLTHSFCPFCGVSYKDTKEVANG